MFICLHNILHKMTLALFCTKNRLNKITLGQTTTNNNNCKITITCGFYLVTGTIKRKNGGMKVKYYR